jgi:hypothetical protein
MIQIPDKSWIMQVITSWEVIFISVVLAAYLSLASYIISFRKNISLPKIKIPKPKLPKKPAPKPVEEEEEEE